jgi:hypothetical protein
VHIRPVETFAQAVSTANDYINDLEVKEPESEQVFITECRRLKDKYTAWHKEAKKPFKGRAKKQRTEDEVAAWKAEQVNKKSVLKAYKADYKTRCRAYKVATRNKKKAGESRLRLYIKGSQELNSHWLREIKSKRLYTSIKYSGSKIISIKLNHRVKLTIDDSMESRRSSWDELFPKESYCGNGWASIAGKYFDKVAKRHGGFIPSTPNARVIDCTLSTSVAGITFKPSATVDMDGRIAHSVDYYRQYASIMREGGFYNIDICHELTPATELTDILLDGKVRSDRIYLVQPLYKTEAALWLSGGFVDYELLSAWYESHCTPKGIADMNNFVVGYLPIAHQPQNDSILKEFVDSVYSTVTCDKARKKLGNYQVGLFVSGYGKRSYRQQFTDDRKEALFYYHTMNCKDKHFESVANYTMSTGENKKVYSVRGYNESHSLSTNIYVNRAIVQRCRAMMLRMVNTIDKTPFANLIAVHVDAIAYTLPSDTAPLFEPEEKATFGDLRPYKEGLDGFSKIEPTEYVIETGDGNPLDPNNIPDKERLGKIKLQYQLSLKNRKELIKDFKKYTSWYDYSVYVATPEMLIGDAQLKKNKVRTTVADSDNDMMVNIDYRYVKHKKSIKGRLKYRGFVEGRAGTGKTHYLNQCVAEMRKRGFRVATASFTHAAAKLVDGCTLHKLFGIKFGSNETTTSKISAVVKKYDAIFIDEVSFMPVECWRILQNFPNDFYIYCYGDMAQLDSVNAPFPIKHTQAMRAVCGNRRITLTKQWRSDKLYVGQVLNYRNKLERNPRGEMPELPEQIKSAKNLSFEQMVDMKHLFYENKPRARFNNRITLHKAQEHKEGKVFSMQERSCNKKYPNYEYPDIDRLASLLRDGSFDDDSSLKLFIRDYIARAELTPSGKWRVGVNYYRPSNDREHARGIQKFPKWIRALVCRDYIDYDFDNCGYRLMRELLKKHNLAYGSLSHYIDNRAECCRRAGINAKEKFIAVLNGCPPSQTPELYAIAREIKALHDHMEKTTCYSDYVEWKCNKAQRKNGMTPRQTLKYLETMRKHAKPETYQEKMNDYDFDSALASRRYMASYIAHLNFEVEAKACKALVNAVEQLEGQKVHHVLCYDGALFYKVKGLDVKVIEELIYDSTGLRLPVKIKPVFDPNDKLLDVVPFTGLTDEELGDLVLPDVDEYPAVYPGMPCVMHETINIDSVRLTNNEPLVFEKLETKDWTRYFVFTREDGTSVSVPEDLARKNSRPAFATTVHKSQGLTIDGAVVMHQFYEKRGDEWKCNPAMRYVGLTRATDPQKVYVC